MSRRKTHEEFINEMKIKNPNIKIMNQYINAQTKVKCQCKLDNYEWNAVPNLLLSGHGCPKCGQNKLRNLFVKNLNDFINELKLINPNILIIGEYINANTKIKCKCLIDGYEWSAKPSHLLDNHECPQCAIKKRSEIRTFTNLDFLSKVKQVNQDIIILDEYTGINNKIKVRCIHDNYEWYISPSNLLRGRGCPVCKASKGEKEINGYLNKYKIYNIPQKEFDGLLGLGNGLLSYDFYLPTYNLLIEYQGKQHERPIDFNSEGMVKATENFKQQQEHDRRKREYAKLHNIELLEIWYWDINNIRSILDDYIKTHNQVKAS